MTPTQVALRLMARGADPAFIVAYMEEEVRRDPLAFATERERMRAENHARALRALQSRVNAQAEVARRVMEAYAVNLRRSMETGFRILAQVGREHTQGDYTLTQ